LTRKTLRQHAIIAIGSGCHWKNGTSVLVTHLTSNCPTSPLRKSGKSNVPKGQALLQPSFKKMSEGASSNTNQLGFVKYDPINIRKLVVQNFISEELPFRHVESDGFRELMNGIEPRFNLPCRVTLQKIAETIRGRKNLFEEFFEG
jgi:hypothetical protein